MRSISFLILICGALLSGCQSVSRVFSGSKRVTLPSTPIISTESLGQVAGQCQKAIDQLRSKEDYVYEARRKEFDSLLSIAEENCDELVTTHDRMKSAGLQEQGYRQNIQYAQSLIVGVPASPANAGDPESFQGNGQFDVPVEEHGTNVGAGIASEPL